MQGAEKKIGQNFFSVHVTNYRTSIPESMVEAPTKVFGSRLDKYWKNMN